ncbi:ribosome biogenesis GTPase Der [bacterium]|nr:ribosome biogenesis GTPase Der [bacterium]MBU1651650.1 ribosome biogenesis GTPase Der [bacterium]MBU1880899.1 ribosome biogenesis GTPase Der [bacterium]
MKLPSVVILGRPNVGKSSLFNRIVGRRQAIVDDKPGITRDRIYARTDWTNQPFSLIDTGGLLPNSNDPLMEAVKEQVEFAADEASVILFMVDWETGITDLDLSIACYLRRLDKRVITVINKVDTTAREQYPKDFIKLGFGDPVMVSAMRGRGVGDLLDLAIDFQEAEPEVYEGLRIAIVGRPNVGKSSIVNAMTGKKTMVVSAIPGTTRDAIDTLIRYQQNNIILVDTAGLRRRGKTKEAVEFYSRIRTARALESADVVWVVMDAVEGMVTADQKIIAEAYSEGKGVLILMNKWDAIEKDNKTLKDWEKNLKIWLGRYAHLPILFVSALQRQRLLKGLDLSMQINAERNKRITTSKLNNVLQPILERTPPPSYRSRFIKIKYISQLASTPPLFGFFCNYPEGIGDSYQKFLERNIREQFGFVGVPIKLAFRKK